MERIDYDAGESSRIEQSLLKVELPGAVLLRHQPALQTVRKPRDHALQVRELLVQIAAQPFELLWFAQVLGRNGLVDPSLRVLGVGPLPVFPGFFLATVLFSLLAFLLVGLGTAVLAHVERIEQIVNGIPETRLVFDEPLETIKIASGAILDQRAP